MRARRFRVLGVGVPSMTAVAACAVLCTVARANADSSATQITLDLRTTYLRELPDLEHTAAAENEGRSLPQADVPTGNAASFVGGGLGFEIAFGDRTRVPLLGLSVVGAVGRSPRVVSSLDGSIVEVDTWKSGIVTLLFPGIGFRSKARRWMFEGAVQPGFAYLFSSGSIANGARSIDTTFHAATFALQGDVAVCRRLDPIDRACLFAAPAIYEFGWLDAFTVGLRWEVGP